MINLLDFSSAIIADKTADKEIVAVDLVGQMEHGYNSLVWLFTTDKAADFTMKKAELINELPELAKVNATALERLW